MNITPYEQGNRYNHDPVRTRKLLLHRKEIEKLIGAVEQQGLTLIPLELYFKNGRAKVALALGRGKKQHDKRAGSEAQSGRARGRPGRLHSGTPVIAALALAARAARPRSRRPSGDHRRGRPDRRSASDAVRRRRWCRPPALLLALARHGPDG